MSCQSNCLSNKNTYCIVVWGFRSLTYRDINKKMIKAPNFRDKGGDGHR